MKLGEYQVLQVIKIVDFGIYLAEHPQDNAKVLLPKKQVPPEIQVGDQLEVFLYRDSKDRLIATTNHPKLTLGNYAALKVMAMGKIGAFLEWGLERDLFLPFKEMTREVREGDTVLATLYIDKSNRLCASMRDLYDLLSTNSPYKQGDTVTGRIYEFIENFGTFVAVDDQFSAMIPLYEDCSMYQIGDVIEAKVAKVKRDGKLDLTLREKAYVQMDADAQKVLEVIDAYAGVLPFNDKASPQVIQREMKMSKSAFKRAVGHLYKERKIQLTETGIRLVES
ncbi:MAG: RNA-binding protein [Eubacterium sp.]|nr:RNA-binding protein [Eubacterium sp.]